MSTDNIIRQLRLRAGLTQIELAARLGCQQARISEIEVGRRSKNPTPKTVFSVASACDCEVTLTDDGWHIEWVQ